ncbi:MAG: Mov34/MPN/PAD-1 family protein [Flavisolibacter sp.]|jgi:proteasome lid subunit RPN8/RPN11
MLDITKDALNSMKDDAVHTYPDECCGFIFGNEGYDNRHITSILVVNNSKDGDKRRRFEIAPRDYLNAELYAEQNEVVLLGVYHSHPESSAIPSETDRLSAQPFFSYIILSVLNRHIDDIRSWRLNDNFQFEEEIINNSFSPVN